MGFYGFLLILGSAFREGLHFARELAKFLAVDMYLGKLSLSEGVLYTGHFLMKGSGCFRSCRSNFKVGEAFENLHSRVKHKAFGS